MTEEYLEYFKQCCLEKQENANKLQEQGGSGDEAPIGQADKEYRTPTKFETTINHFINQYVEPNKYNESRIFTDNEVKILQIILKEELNYDISEDELSENLHIQATQIYYDAFNKKFTADNPNLDINFSEWIKAYVDTFDSNYNFIDFLSVKMDELQIDFPFLDIQDIEDFCVQAKENNFRIYCELLNAVEHLEDITIGMSEDEVLEYEDFKIIYYLSRQKIEGWKYVYSAIAINREIEQRYLRKQAQQHKENMSGGGKIKKNRIEINNIDTMDGISFEKFLAHLFANMNYKTEITQASNDQGADLIIEKLGERTVVQAKCYSSTVGNTAVQEVTGAKQYYNCTKAMVITNNYFTKSAIELAYANNVELKDREDLINLLENYPVYAEDIFITGT